MSVSLKGKKYGKSDAIRKEMMEWLVNNLCTSKRRSYQRTLLVMFLLYCTGLRMSNLMLFRVINLKELIDKGSTNIKLLKSKGENITVYLTKKQVKELNKGRLFKACCICVNNKSFSDFVFTTFSKGFPLVTRRHMIHDIQNQLNILNMAKYKGRFRLTTHSFRIGYITRRLEKSPVQLVAKMVGHKNLNTTMSYDRNILSSEDMFKYQDSDWDDLSSRIGKSEDEMVNMIKMIGLKNKK